MSNFPDLSPQAVDLGLPAPVLLVVVDTEEEFDWNKPFDRQSTGTKSILEQERAHALFDRFGVVPTYVIDYPVATSQVGARYLRKLVEEGRAEFGAHCHPWVTPPHREEVSLFNSYHGNLPRELEEAKIRTSTDAVAQAIGQRPRIFKAGRYGLGPNTLGILREIGYTVDCSVVPHTSFAVEGGPNYLGMPDRPFFTDASRSLFEVPLTVGYSGHLQRFGPSNTWIHERRLSRALHLPGLLSRVGWLERARLSPEGFDAQTLKRLMKTMLKQGVSVFTMTYHSTTLQVGNTPYVNTESDLQRFLATIETVLQFFRDELGGRYSTLSRLDALARSPRGVS